jgi:hypothetical protein
MQHDECADAILQLLVRGEILKNVVCVIIIARSSTALQNTCASTAVSTIPYTHRAWCVCVCVCVCVRACLYCVYLFIINASFSARVAKASGALPSAGNT